MKAGLTPAKALAAATIEAARFLGRDSAFGTVTAGKHADLVLFDANPLERIDHTRAIQAVILGGRLIDRHELDRMLAQAEVEARRR